MAEIVEFRVADGGVLRVQAVDGLSGGDSQGLVPASSVGEKVQKASQSLETAIGSITPALGVVTRQLRRLSPDEVTVEFGLMLGAEYGVVLAKASGEVHFTVTLAWKQPAGADSEQPGAGALVGPADADDVPALDAADTAGGQGGGG